MLGDFAKEPGDADFSDAELRRQARPGDRIWPRIDRSRPGLTLGSAENFHDLSQFLALILLVTAGNRVLNAMRDVVTENLFLGAPKCCPDRRNLGDDVDAIAILVDHPGEASNLAFDTIEPSSHGRLCFILHA